MEDVFNKNNEKKYSQITLSVNVINKLKSLNKGSMNDTMLFLLGSKDNKIDTRLNCVEEGIVDLQEKFEKLINLNKDKIRFF